MTIIPIRVDVWPLNRDRKVNPAWASMGVRGWSGGEGFIRRPDQAVGVLEPFARKIDPDRDSHPRRYHASRKYDRGEQRNLARLSADYCKDLCEA